jgi:hypothetical protein
MFLSVLLQLLVEAYVAVLNPSAASIESLKLDAAQPVRILERCLGRLEFERAATAARDAGAIHILYPSYCLIHGTSQIATLFTHIFLPSIPSYTTIHPIPSHRRGHRGGRARRRAANRLALVRGRQDDRFRRGRRGRGRTAGAAANDRRDQSPTEGHRFGATLCGRGVFVGRRRAGAPMAQIYGFKYGDTISVNPNNQSTTTSKINIRE